MFMDNEKYFQKITDYDGFLKDSFYAEYAKKRSYESCIETPQAFGRYGVRNDYWNAYRYGDEIKIVYIKRGIIERENKKHNFKPEKKTSDDGRFSQSLSRTRARVFELASCNEFSFFCTFTQDEKMRDRFDLKAFREDFTMLIRNLNRARSESEKIRYILIPEQHKNGAWHMHGLLSGINENDLREFKLSERIPKNIKDSIRRGVPVYDWLRYRKKFGYFTCTKIENTTACAKYITKYITKDLSATSRENGAHLYFASQGLKGRECLVKNSFDECPFSSWDFENEYVKIKVIKGGDCIG